MKRTTLFYAAILIMVIVITGLVIAGQSSRKNAESAEKSPAETQWEYLVVGGGNLNLSSAGISEKMHKQEGGFSREAVVLERNLDKLGAKGWELVAVSGDPRDPVFYLKRAKEMR